MGYKIPQPIKQLTAQLAVQTSRSYFEPSEGKSYIPVELDWDGAGSTFQINCQGIGTKPFSQIVMLDVDNTASGADVTFYFPDSTDTLVVPAYEAGLFPVFTGGLLFYAGSPLALASDVTRVRILNYLQNPVGNPPPQFHDVASNVIAGLGTGTTAIIAAGISGTLSSYSSFGAAFNGATPASAFVKLLDHASGLVIDNFYFVHPANGYSNNLAMRADNIAIRFASGIDLNIVINGGPYSGGAVSVSLRYRTP